MNLSEFKAWFEGFSENLGAAPTEAQWSRIREKIGAIKPDPTPPKVFVDRYWPRHLPYWDRPWWGCAEYSANDARRRQDLAAQWRADNPYKDSDAVRQSFLASGPVGRLQNGGDSGSATIDMTAAFRDLGRTEAEEMARA